IRLLIHQGIVKAHNGKGSPKKTRIRKTPAEVANPVADQKVFDDKILHHVKKQSAQISLIELANKFDVAPAKIMQAIERLRSAHYTIELGESGGVRVAQPRTGGRTEVQAYKEGNLVRYGLVSDAHLGSKYEQLDKLHLMYDIFAEKGIKHVYDTGNWIDGEARFNLHDIHAHGLDNQVNYWAD